MKKALIIVTLSLATAAQAQMPPPPGFEMSRASNEMLAACAGVPDAQLATYGVQPPSRLWISSRSGPDAGPHLGAAGILPEAEE
jgi:hypothetical protein